MSTVAIVLELIRLGLPIAQEIVQGVNLEMSLSGRGRAPTEDEMKQLDAALFVAHEALQSAQQAPTAEA